MPLEIDPVGWICLSCGAIYKSEKARNNCKCLRRMNEKRAQSLLEEAAS